MKSSRRTYAFPRPYMDPTRGQIIISVPICVCYEPRGPEGGCCGGCGNAIPTDKEKQQVGLK